VALSVEWVIKPSVTEAVFAPKIELVTDNEEPSRTNPLTDKVLDEWIAPSADKQLPNLAKDRSERELPKLTTSTTERLMREPI
jgi:hypothetical protein